PRQAHYRLVDPCGDQAGPGTGLPTMPRTMPTHHSATSPNRPPKAIVWPPLSAPSLKVFTDMNPVEDVVESNGGDDVG
ncbi:Hypothetical predicted protein, partial [Marmota monax]